MSVTIDQVGTCCLNVQQALESVVAGSTAMKIKNPGMLDAIRSQRNRALIQGLDSQDPNGRNLTNQVRYWPPMRAAASGTKLSQCEPGASEDEKFANITLGTTASVKLTMQADEFLGFCTDFNSAREMLILQKLNQLYDKISADAAAYALANAGNYGDGTSSVGATKSLAFINTAGNAANILGEIAMKQEYEGIEGIDRPFVVASGTSLFDTYSKLRAIGCCTDSGIDLATAADFDYYRDNRVGTAASNVNKIVTFSPGALQIGTRVRNVGAQEFVMTDKAHTTIVDPRYGWLIDLDLKYQDCPITVGEATLERVWTWVFSLKYGFFNLPSDLEPAGSPFEGVNNILLFNGTCGAGDVCPAS